MSNLVEKVESRKRNPWLTQEMISKMDERREWKSVKSEEWRKNYRRLKNERTKKTKTVIYKAKTEYLESRCDEIVKFQGTGLYGLMHMSTTERDYKEYYEIRTTGIEDTQGHVIVNVREVLKMWQNYAQWSGKAIKRMKDNKATWDDDALEDVLKLLGEDGLELTKLMIAAHDMKLERRTRSFFEFQWSSWRRN